MEKCLCGLWERNYKNDQKTDYNCRGKRSWENYNIKRIIANACLLCDDIETVISPYGFHGERKSIYDEVIRRLRDKAKILQNTLLY